MKTLLKKLVRWLYERLNWQVNILGSESPSQVNSESDEIGQRLTDIVFEIHMEPKAIQSDWARHNDAYVAAAASIGYITNITHDGYVSRRWRITSMGLTYLEDSYVRRMQG